MGREVREIEINGVRWRLPPGDDGSLYLTDYYRLVDQIKRDKDPLGWYADTVLHDLYFIVVFVLRVPLYVRLRDGRLYPFAAHPFVVRACREVQLGPDTDTIDLWARGHFKSTIITTAEVIQRICTDRNCRIALFSHSRHWALKNFFGPVKQALEESELLKRSFPDVLYMDPGKEAVKWSDDSGLFVKRDTYAREATLGAYGLIESMPTGGHFTDLYYDDMMVEDLVSSPEQMSKLKEMYDQSLHLGTIGTRKRIVGTTYHHDDVYEYLASRVDPETHESVYHVRRKPGTVDGEFNGASVFMPEEELAEKRANRHKFSCQILLNPTPVENAELRSELLVRVSRGELPSNLWRFMAVDPAGKRKDRVGDAWAICVVGVEPVRDDIGASRVYVLDLVIEVMTLEQALRTIVEMYCRHGRIVKLGVEKVGMSTMEVHVSNALSARGRMVNIENGGLEVLNPGGRDKVYRIVSALQWPLNNGKLHVLDEVKPAYLGRLEMEMKRFPSWHDDGLDALSYVFDLIKGYRFGKGRPVEEDRWEREWHRKGSESLGERSWMVC